MRIAFFNWRDIKHPQVGGAEVLAHNLLKRIAARGHPVTLFSSTFKGSKMHERIDGIEHIRYGGRFFIYPKSFLCYKRHIEGKYDVIVECINGMPFFTPLFAREKVIPFVPQLTRENWFSGLSFPLAFVGYHLEDPILRLYSGLPAIALSGSTKNDLDAVGFRDVTIVEPGISPPPSGQAKRKESRPTLIFLGRLVKSKRADHALRAFKIIRSALPKARLWIVGAGAEEGRLKALARDLGIESSVEFHGKVDEQRKDELLSKAHLMLFPATREGWGLVVLEANIRGTPVIGYGVPGVLDSISEAENGFIVSSGDYDAMAKRAISLLKDVGRLKKLSAGSINHAKKYTWDRCVDRFLSVIGGSV